MNNLFLFSWACFPCRCVHGTCLPINAFSYSCKCLQGHGGVLCDEDEKLFNPCQSIRCKHGKCRLSGLGKPYCECSSGYTGDSCDKGKNIKSHVVVLVVEFFFNQNMNSQKHYQHFFPTIHTSVSFLVFTIRIYLSEKSTFSHEFVYIFRIFSSSVLL